MIENIDAKSDLYFPELQILILSHNHLERLESDCFMALIQLQRLCLDNNNIKHLSLILFNGLSKLKYLDLSHNSLRHVAPNQFSDLKSLQYLNLTSCFLVEINKSIFNGLSDLIHLELGDNVLQFLDGDVFEGVTKLKVLSLNDNQLSSRTSFPLDIFRPLTNLEELHLVGICYYFTTLVPGCRYIDEQLSKVPSLKRLHLDGLPNPSLGHGFASLVQLEYLRFGKYFLLPCQIVTISNETFKNLKNTMPLTIVLSDCEISTIMPNAFADINNLTSLDLSFNKYLCEEGFHNLTTGLRHTSIKHLLVQGICSITWQLEWPLFQGLQDTELQSLDISSCAIYFIIPNVFMQLPKSLEVFNLSYNILDRMLPLHLIYLRYIKGLVWFDLSHQGLIDGIELPARIRNVSTKGTVVYPEGSVGSLETPPRPRFQISYENAILWFQ